ncbi:MAG: hypothetical protein MHM6MM_001024 [Cercozoa sp. M6MM]
MCAHKSIERLLKHVPSVPRFPIMMPVELPQLLMASTSLMVHVGQPGTVMATDTALQRRDALFVDSPSPDLHTCVLSDVQRALHADPLLLHRWHLRMLHALDSPALYEIDDSAEIRLSDLAQDQTLAKRIATRLSEADESDAVFVSTLVQTAAKKCPPRWADRTRRLKRISRALASVSHSEISAYLLDRSLEAAISRNLDLVTEGEHDILVHTWLPIREIVLCASNDAAFGEMMQSLRVTAMANVLATQEEKRGTALHLSELQRLQLVALFDRLQCFWLDRVASVVPAAYGMRIARLLWPMLRRQEEMLSLVPDNLSEETRFMRLSQALSSTFVYRILTERHQYATLPDDCVKVVTPASVLSDFGLRWALPSWPKLEMFENEKEEAPPLLHMSLLALQALPIIDSLYWASQMRELRTRKEIVKWVDDGLNLHLKRLYRFVLPEGGKPPVDSALSELASALTTLQKALERNMFIRMYVHLPEYTLQIRRPKPGWAGAELHGTLWPAACDACLWLCTTQDPRRNARIVYAMRLVTASLYNTAMDRTKLIDFLPAPKQKASHRRKGVDEVLEEFLLSVQNDENTAENDEFEITTPVADNSGSETTDQILLSVAESSDVIDCDDKNEVTKSDSSSAEEHEQTSGRGVLDPLPE